MLTIGKTMLSLVLLVLFVCVAAAPLACLNINRAPDRDRPNTEVNVGGDRGVTVEHNGDKDKHDNN